MKVEKMRMKFTRESTIGPDGKEYPGFCFDFECEGDVTDEQVDLISDIIGLFCDTVLEAERIENNPEFQQEVQDV